MEIASLTANEEDRLAALASYDLSAGTVQREMAGLLEIAKSFFRVPTVLVSLVERHRQFFAARVGLDACSTDRDVSFCSHALHSVDMLLVPDAKLDQRFHDNPLVIGPPFIRFYAGCPLVSGSGHIIGTFCLIDSRARENFSVTDANNLRAFTELALDKLEIHRLERAGRDINKRFETIAENALDATVCCNQSGEITFWNQTATSVFGFSRTWALGRSIHCILPSFLNEPRVISSVHSAAEAARDRKGVRLERDARRADGSTFPVEISLSAWSEVGKTHFGLSVREAATRQQLNDFTGDQRALAS